jgi:hypothetical protein
MRSILKEPHGEYDVRHANAELPSCVAWVASLPLSHTCWPALHVVRSTSLRAEIFKQVRDSRARLHIQKDIQ